MEIRNLRVTSLDVDRKELSWTYHGQEDPRDYTFQVLRSESPMGPFDVASEPFEDRYFFIDSRLPGPDKFRQIWYRLRVTHKATTVVTEFGPSTQEADPDLLALYVRNQLQTLFQRLNGRQVWLFKARTFGPRCPSCWDVVMGMSTREKCLDCFSTGYLRGFLDPIAVWMTLSPGNSTPSPIEQQVAQHVTCSAQMTSYPNVTPGDVVIEAENKRWRVQRASTSERLRATVKQTLDLRQLNEDDIEYSLPLNLSRALRDVHPSPDSWYENATDLASISSRTPDVFSAFIPEEDL